MQDTRSAERFLESFREPVPARPKPWWKRRRMAGTAVGVAVVLAIGTGYAVTLPGPEDVVRDYLDVLRSGDAEAALAYASEDHDLDGIPDDLLTDEAMSGDWEVTGLARRHAEKSSTAAVDVTITAPDSTRRTGRFHLEDADGQWHIRNPFVKVDLALLPMRFAEFNGLVVKPGNNETPNGRAVQPGSEPVWLFPGAYEIFRKSSQLVELSVPTYVAVPGGPGLDGDEVFGTRLFMPTIVAGDELRPELNWQLAAWIDECAASTEVNPPGCPFAAGVRGRDDFPYVDAVAHDRNEVTWTVESYPEIEAVPEAGAFTVRELTPGEMSIKGDGISARCGIELDRVLFELVEPGEFEFSIPEADEGHGVTYTCASGRLPQDRTGESESQVVDLQNRHAAASHRGPAAPVLVTPPAAAQHAVVAVDVGVVDVPAPFPHVAEHVVQAPRVGQLAAHLVDVFVGILAVPGDLVQPPVARARGRGAAGVLPLGLGGQPVPVGRGVPRDVAVGRQPVRGWQALAPGQFVAEPDAVQPRHVDHGHRFAVLRARTLAGHPFVTRPGDRERGELERTQLDRPVGLRPPVRESYPARGDVDHPSCAHRRAMLPAPMVDALFDSVEWREVRRVPGVDIGDGLHGDRGRQEARGDVADDWRTIRQSGSTASSADP